MHHVDRAVSGPKLAWSWFLIFIVEANRRGRRPFLSATGPARRCLPDWEGSAGVGVHKVGTYLGTYVRVYVRVGRYLGYICTVRWALCIHMCPCTYIRCTLPSTGAPYLGLHVCVRPVLHPSVCRAHVFCTIMVSFSFPRLPDLAGRHRSSRGSRRLPFHATGQVPRGMGQVPVRLARCAGPNFSFACPLQSRRLHWPGCATDGCSRFRTDGSTYRHRSRTDGRCETRCAMLAAQASHHARTHTSWQTAASLPPSAGPRLRCAAPGLCCKTSVTKVGTWVSTWHVTGSGTWPGSARYLDGCPTTVHPQARRLYLPR